MAQNFDATQRNYPLALPTGLSTLQADISAFGAITGSAVSIIVGGTNETLATPTQSGGFPTNPSSTTNNNSSNSASFAGLVPLDSSAQIGVTAAGTCVGSGITTFGFIHSRGANA